MVNKKDIPIFYCDLNNCLNCPLDECASTKKYGTINGVKTKIVINDDNSIYKSSNCDRYRRYGERQNSP